MPRKLYRKHRITPTVESLKDKPIEMLIMMAANESGLLSHDGLARIAAEIKRQNNLKNQA